VWLLFARNTNGWTYVHQFPRAQFIAVLRATASEGARQFADYVNDLPKLIADHEAHSRSQSVAQPRLRSVAPWRSPRL
jgi:hypothetical protein